MNKKIKFGIIGYGRIGTTHFNTIDNIISAEVISICDPYLTKEKEKELLHRGILKENIFDNVDKFLGLKEVDAIILCTPTNTHFEIIVKAATVKKHIFCEKPVSSSRKEMQKVEELIIKNKIHFQVGFNRRYDHNFMALRKSIQNKESGNLYILSITSFDPLPPPIEYIKISGGLFKDMTIHDFDMVRFLTGQNVTEVFAQGSVLVDKNIEGIDIDVATISMKLKNGALVTINNSRKAAHGYEQTAYALTENGMYSIKNDRKNTLVSATKKGTTHNNPLDFFMDRYADAYKREIKEFIDLIINNKKSATTNLDCLEAIKIAEAAFESLKTKKTIVIK